MKWKLEHTPYPKGKELAGVDLFFMFYYSVFPPANIELLSKVDVT